MGSIYDLKPRFQDLLRPACRGLVAAGATANQVTVAALVLSVATGALLAWRPDARWPLLLVPPVLLTRMALNALDGMMAREHGMTSALGAMLNELGDVLSDAALYLPFALVRGVPAPLVVLVVVLAGLSEMAGVVSVQVGASRRHDGPLGKSDRAFAFGLLGLLLGLGVPAGVWVTALLGAMMALLGLTVLRRCRRALAETRP